MLPCEGDQSAWANSERWARPRLLCRSIFGLDDNDQCKSVDGIMVLMVIIMVVVMVKMVAAINFASRICSSLSVTLVPLWKGWWFLIKKYNERVIESGNKYICWWFLQNIFDDDFYIIYLLMISTNIFDGDGADAGNGSWVGLKTSAANVHNLWKDQSQGGEIQDRFKICSEIWNLWWNPRSIWNLRSWSI